MTSIERNVIRALLCGAGLAVCGRAVTAVLDLQNGDVSAFLAFPLTVILPGLAFVFIAGLRDMVSQEGALMQLGVLIQLLLILMLPTFALYLVLGCPVVFLVVEVFETKAPPALREAIKRRVLT